MVEKVSLKEFLRTGQLGRVCLGMPEHEVTAIFGTSNSFGGMSRKYPKPSLFAYGDIELIYENDSRRLNLILINSWKPKYPFGGSTIDLDPWIIRGGLQAEELISQLKEEDIPFCDVKPINYETRQLLVGSIVTMIFNNNVEEWKGQEGLCKLYAGK